MPSINLTEAELETISAALEEYIHHDDPDADPADLIGGLSVADRCDSIQNKIAALLTKVALAQINADK